VSSSMGADQSSKASLGFVMPTSTESGAARLPVGAFGDYFSMAVPIDPDFRGQRISPNQCFQFQCQMDFAHERLHFDIQRGISARDDGTAEVAERMADFHGFIYDYLCNGELRILDAVTGDLLSHKDAFLPLNCTVNDQVCNANIEHWKTTAQRRRENLKNSEGRIAGGATGFHPLNLNIQRRRAFPEPRFKQQALYLVPGRLNTPTTVRPAREPQ
jgi:hypothetical protein